jgi:hypothetical protein
MPKHKIQSYGIQSHIVKEKLFLRILEHENVWQASYLKDSQQIKITTVTANNLSSWQLRKKPRVPNNQVKLYTSDTK